MMKYPTTPRVRSAAAAIATALADAVQPLEKRVLLSTTSNGGVFDVHNLPHFTASSGNLMDLKHGPMAKAGGTLAQLYHEYRKFVRKGGAEPANFLGKQKALNNMLTFGRGDRGDLTVAVTVRTYGSMDDLTNVVQPLGGKVIVRNGAYNAADVMLPVSALRGLAANGLVAAVEPAGKPVTARGVASNQADRGLVADATRTAFGVDGTGVKVGVLSDSFSHIEGGYHDSITTGDLPKGVQVLDDSFPGGEDEGRAMLELIHDIAPGAQLAFATAGVSVSQMARNIIALADAGCKVIVDDIGFVTESLFQNSVVSDAIGEVKHNYGVTYLSCAHNQDRSAFEQEIHWVKAADGRMMADFDPGSGVDTRMDVDFVGFSGIFLTWDDPYNGVTGSPTVDLDVDFFERDTGEKITGGGDDNFATGVPTEFFAAPPDHYSMELYVANRNGAKTLPTRFKMRTFNAPLFNFEYDGLQAATGGHNAPPDGLGVGAVPFFLAPTIQNRIGVNSEHFSSLGPVTLLFDSAGHRLSKPRVLQKPDLSAIDGVNTSFFPPGKGNDDPHDADQLPNFFGTSAAAPNAAAVAVLLKQLVPTATPDEIIRSLVESAKQQPLNGSRSGAWDPQGGFGLINAIQAAHFLSPKNPISQIATILPESQARGVQTLQIKFSEPVTGFDKSDLILQRGAKGSNLLGSGAVKLTTNDNQTFFLKNLSKITGKPGNYTLTVKGGGATSIAKGQSTLGSSAGFSVNGKPTGVQAIPVSDSEVDLMWTDNTPNEKRFKIYRAADPSFRQNLQVFDVSPNQSVFKDKGLESGFTYYYKVKAVTTSSGGDPTSSRVSTTTLSRNEVVVDNSNTRQTDVEGKWQHSVFGNGFVGGDYLISADPGASVTYTPDIPVAGTYFVYVRNVAASNRSTDATVSVAGKGTAVNQQKGNGWKLLGTFSLDKGTSKSVTIRSTGSGVTVADAVRFQLADSNASKKQKSPAASARPAAAASSQTIAARASLFSHFGVALVDDPTFGLS